MSAALLRWVVVGLLVLVIFVASMAARAGLLLATSRSGRSAVRDLKI